MLKVGRLSKWYRALAYAFIGRSEAESLLKELIQAQEKDPLEYESYSDAFINNLANPSSAFDLDYLQLALLHFYVETDNRLGYERYIETVYPPLFSMRFDWISQMHVLLNENGHEDGRRVYRGQSLLELYECGVLVVAQGRMALSPRPHGPSVLGRTRYLVGCDL